MSNDKKEKAFYDKLLLIKQNNQSKKINVVENITTTISNKASQFIIKTRLCLYYAKNKKN